MVSSVARSLYIFFYDNIRSERTTKTERYFNSLFFHARTRCRHDHSEDTFVTIPTFGPKLRGTTTLDVGAVIFPRFRWGLPATGTETKLSLLLAVFPIPR